MLALIALFACGTEPADAPAGGEPTTVEVTDEGTEDSAEDSAEDGADDTAADDSAAGQGGDWESPHGPNDWDSERWLDTGPIGSDVYGEVICSEPRPGEPPGLSEGGLVCTEQSMHGCTEAGRRFDDYVSCESLYDTRGYYPVPVDFETPADDPRLDDAEWMAELDWATEQAEACSCVCCHSTESTPAGPAKWFVEADPIWTDSGSDYTIAFFAGWVDSDRFGSQRPELNNGFDRDTTGIPTTDIQRMKAFLEGEADRRGISEEDFEGGGGGGGFPF